MQSKLVTREHYCGQQLGMRNPAAALDGLLPATHLNGRRRLSDTECRTLSRRSSACPTATRFLRRHLGIAFATERSCRSHAHRLAASKTHSRHGCKAQASSSSSGAVQQSSSVNTSLVFSVALVLVFGVLNRVLNKMATVPMGGYVFFLAQVQTFGYVLFYGAVLAQRRRSGTVTQDMLEATDKKRFVLIGALEAAAQLLSLLCVSKLPGVIIPLLQQTILLWQVALGYFFQGERFERIQLLGIALVGLGVAKAAWPSGHSSSVLGKTNPAYAALFCLAFLLLALVAVVKNSIFSDAKARLGGRQLDLFVVNTNGSLAQAGFVLLLLPVLSSLQGIPFKQLPAYFSEGFNTLRGATLSSTGAPLVPLIYIVVNLTMNVAALNLIRTAGPVVTTLTLSLLVPLSIWAFTWPWPLLGAPAALSTGFIVGTLMLLTGLAAFNYPRLRSA